MRKRWATLIVSALLTVALAVLLIYFFGDTADASPPYVTDLLSAGAGPALPGQPLDVGVPIAVRSGTVVLESAELVPMKGFPVPRLMGTAVTHGKDWMVVTRGWPITNSLLRRSMDSAVALPVRPLAGYAVTPGNPAVIYYSIRGDRPGTAYYAEGLRLRYRRGSREYSTTLYQVGEDCVLKSSQSLARAPACGMPQAAASEMASLPHS